MRVSRVLDRASTHGKLVMVAVPFQWVNLPRGTTYAPSKGLPTAGTGQSGLYSAPRPANGGCERR
jgi:hypothetical protein